MSEDLPDLSNLGRGAKRSRRDLPRKDYTETFEPEDVELASTIHEVLLPGLLKISNATFVARRSNIKRSSVGLVVVVTHDRVTEPSGRQKGVIMVHHPFQDTMREPAELVIEQIRAAVIDVRDYWKTNPRGTVLVHCNAGQNRSAAVVLAIMLSYRVPEDRALQHVMDTQFCDTNGPGAKSTGDQGWQKFVGENGDRLRKLVLAMF